MLTQVEADRLMSLGKRLRDPGPLVFPLPGDSRSWEAESEGGRELFLIDVNRKGRIKVSRCTYLERYAIVEILLRLDIDGPTHENPDGTEVPTPHLHVYREGFADKWAIPLPSNRFTSVEDLAHTFREFLEYCNVIDIPNIQRGVL